MLNFKEILEYKDVLFELVRRDLKIRYKQTVLGVLWVLIQPLLTTIVFTLVFGLLIKNATSGIPYPVFVLTGLLFWTFFSNGLLSASSSLIADESLIKKVYLPRIIIPLSAVLVTLVDFFVMLTFFGFALILFKINFDIFDFLAILTGALVVALTVFGSGLFLSALNVKYRDVRHILPFFIQILIFVTPVFYPISIVSPEKRWLLMLNPLTVVIETVRGFLSNSYSLSYYDIAIAIGVMLISLNVGLWYFQKTEKSFADEL